MAAPFADSEFMTAKDKQAVQRNFTACLEQRSLEKMDKRAYNFYNLYCGFIAHYDIHGFRTEYAGLAFLNFLEPFAKPGLMYGPHLNHPEVGDLCWTLHRLARDEFANVEREMVNRLHNAKVQRLRALADELGYRIVPKDVPDSADDAVLVGVEDDGRLTLCV